MFISANIFLSPSCNDGDHKPAAVVVSDTTTSTNNFAADHAFLTKHLKHLVKLESEDGRANVLVTADYQGRVMTSTATGDSGKSYGWINYKLIASGKKNKQFNPVGGEERFWLGPEGGQFSLYFKAGDPFDIGNWQVPPIIDTEFFDVKRSDKHSASFFKKAALTNYAGTVFNVDIERTITLLNKKQLEQRLKQQLPAGIDMVAYETSNTITNTGDQDWVKEKGLLSIWLLGMFTPSRETTVIIPFDVHGQAKNFITDNYFGELPASRLKVEDSILYFTCDGNYRSKIGISPVIARPVAGSFDFTNQVLTVIIFPVVKHANYVNAKWEMQEHPYNGDVVNAYNDGPLADGSQLGPFYELESSSPALELKKGGRQQYTQVTCHFEGDYSSLRQLARSVLGVDLE
jgi:hypothetical protein